METLMRISRIITTLILLPLQRAWQWAESKETNVSNRWSVFSCCVVATVVAMALGLTGLALLIMLIYIGARVT